MVLRLIPVVSGAGGNTGSCDDLVQDCRLSSRNGTEALPSSTGPTTLTH